MANQVGPDTVGGATSQSGQVAGPEPTPAQVASAAPGTLPDPGHTHASFHGRAISWVAVSVIMLGFVLGGFALVFGPTWVAFWVGAGLAAVGGLLALLTDIFEDWY
jgi:ABC-type transport system involved in cytochrome c biogenesis permease subunit